MYQRSFKFLEISVTRLKSFKGLAHQCPCRLFREHWVINLPRAQKSRFLRENSQKSLKNRRTKLFLTDSEGQHFRLAVESLKSTLGLHMPPCSPNNRHGSQGKSLENWFIQRNHHNHYVLQHRNRVSLRKIAHKSLKNRRTEFFLTDSERQDFRLSVEPLKSALGKFMTQCSRNNRHGHE